GAEDLFLQHAALRAEAGDDGRLDEKAFAVDAIAAGDDRAAFLFRETDVAHHLSEVRRGDERAVVFAEAQAARHRDEALDERVVDRLLDEDPRAAEADLALVPETRAERRRNRLIEIGVGEDHGWILAAQLERQL